MSMYYRENGRVYEPEFGPGRTKQSFKDSTDINKILKKAWKTGTVSHIQKHGAHYGEYGDIDFLQESLKLARGREIFEELPAEVRREFNNQPGEFFAFVNDPQNADQLERVLPALAEPGRQRIVPNRGAAATSAPVNAEPASEDAAPVSPPEVPPASGESV